MNLYMRLIYVLLTTIGKPQLHPRVPTSRTFIVWPWDIDAFLHMNNGRYSQIMDVARVDWMRRSRILDAIFKNRWGGLLGGSLVRFRRSLKPFQRYRVWTEVVSWDQRWFYIEHRFETMDGKMVAIGLTRAGLQAKGKWINTEMVVDAVVPGLRSPAHPRRVLDWLNADRLLCATPEDEQKHLDLRKDKAPLEDAETATQDRMMAAE